MIIVVKNSCEKAQFANLVDWIKDLGLDVHVSRGETSTVLGLVGDTSRVDIDLISTQNGHHTSAFKIKTLFAF